MNDANSVKCVNNLQKILLLSQDLNLKSPGDLGGLRGGHMCI